MGYERLSCCHAQKVISGRRQKGNCKLTCECTKTGPLISGLPRDPKPKMTKPTLCRWRGRIPSERYFHPQRWKMIFYARELLKSAIVLELPGRVKPMGTTGVENVLGDATVAVFPPPLSLSTKNETLEGDFIRYEKKCPATLRVSYRSVMAENNRR